MTYRDDRDADQARIAALEGELAHAKQRIAELEGNRAQALVLASKSALAKSTASRRWLGAPTKLELARRFEGTYPLDHFEDLIETIREHTGDRGRTELLRSSFAWWPSTSERGLQPFTSVTVTVKDGATTLTVADRLSGLAGAIYGGGGGGVGGGLMMVPIGATIVAPYLAPVFFAGWFGAIYAGCRALYRRSARKRAERLQTLFDRLEREIAARLV